MQDILKSQEPNLLAGPIGTRECISLQESIERGGFQQNTIASYILGMFLYVFTISLDTLGMTSYRLRLALKSNGSSHT